MKLGRILVGMGMALLMTLPVRGQAEKRRVIIDTDPGTDDAMAILLALNSPELKVEAVSVVPGNVVAKQGLENALKLVSLAGRCDIPVAAGRAASADAKDLYGAVLAWQQWAWRILSCRLRTAKSIRVSLPISLSSLVHKYPHEITLIPIGPLTNIALAVSKDPSIVRLVKDIVIMGGSISAGM